MSNGSGRKIVICGSLVVHMSFESVVNLNNTTTTAVQTITMFLINGFRYWIQISCAGLNHVGQNGYTNLRVYR